MKIKLKDLELAMNKIDGSLYKDDTIEFNITDKTLELTFLSNIDKKVHTICLYDSFISCTPEMKTIVKLYRDPKS